MSKLRRTLTALVLSALAVAGALPAATASAATTAIRWEAWFGTTLERESSVDVCASGTSDLLAQGGTVAVEVLVAGSWQPKQQVSVTDAWTRCVSVVPGQLIPGPGQYAFRAQYRPAPGAAALLASTTFSVVKSETGASVYNDHRLSLTTTRGRNVRVDVFPARGQYVDLQRRSGASWIHVARVRAGSTGYSSTVRLPVPTRAGLSHYRVLVRGTHWSKPSVPQAVAMHQTDMVKHGSFVAKARYYMARFCPKTPIYVDTPAVLPGNPMDRWGQANLDVSWPSPGRPGRISATIELRSAMDAGQLRHLALHECAHVVQWRAHVVGERDVEEQRAWRLWPRVGDEGQADCMAYERTRAARYLYYVRGCTSSQLINAARMWRDYGTRFQAEPYTWGG